MRHLLKKYPIRCISVASLLAWGAFAAWSLSNSGVEYHELYQEAMGVDSESATMIRQKMEAANLMTIIECLYAALIAFGAWYIACSVIAIRRMKRAGISRAWERCILSVFPLLLLLIWCDSVLDSRPTSYNYEAYSACLCQAGAVICLGILLSAITHYFLCLRPWKKRANRREI